MKKIILCDTGNFKKVSELCKKYNLGVNININTPECYLKFNPNEINEIIEGYKNVTIGSIYGSFKDLNFTSNDELIRKVTAKRYEYIYKISFKFNCKNIILPYSYDPRYISPSLKVGAGFWTEYLKNKDKETIFYIENIMDPTPGFINCLIDLININKENLKMCFDIGHAIKFSKLEITEWIKQVNKNIGIVNLYNISEEGGKPNALNNGIINMDEICTALEQYCPNAIWKINTVEYEKSIKWLRENKYIK